MGPRAPALARPRTPSHPASYDVPVLPSPIRRVLAWLCVLVTWIALFAVLVTLSVAAGEVLPEVLSWIVDGLLVGALFVLGIPAKRAILRRFGLTRPGAETSTNNSDQVRTEDPLT